MILSAFVSACASKLAGLIADRIAAGLGVEDDVRSLQRRMERVAGAVLADAERRRRRLTGEHEASAGAWIDELRDFLYDADDVLDLCRCRGERLLAERRPRSRPLMATVNLVSSLQKLQARLEIGAQISRLNRRFEEICKDRLFLSLAVDDSKAEDGGSRGGGGGGSRVRTRTSTPLLDTNVVGKEIKSATEALVEKIMRDDGRGEVVAVVGMGGIGKTTLAQRVFSSRRITGGFPVRAWLCISREYSETDTVKEAIRCCGGDYGRAETLAELQLILRSAVAGKRVFLVLDDVWDAGVWTSLLRIPFHGATGRVRVLITTRDQRVAARAGANHIHQVKRLGSDSGWELLHRTARLDGADEMQSLRDVGMAIVAKCGFLPLTIKVIGGLLMTKRRSRAEWERVLGSDAWSTAELRDEFKGAILLSYEDLPPHLKQCFLYFSLFPADFVYYRCHICRQWVAEGFIAASGQHMAEEIAEARSILQPHPDYLADQSRFCLKFPPLGQLPHLTFLKIDCPKLRALPEQLKHATKMQRLRIQGVHALKKIENLHELSGSLRINGSRSLASISDLYQIKELYVADCTALQFVNNLNALKWLYLEDETMDCIPMWLSRLTENGEQAGEDGLELELHCSTDMLDRCLMGRQDWTIMERFTSVAAYCKEDYMCYSRHPVSYHTSKSVSNSK
ncbi:hypothetical protein OsI_25851 [Oryza sativa Indica Group]|uniref:Uncharacterized protein n=1 Tax=Oryza sativa subsp. indica TaxID=39946 RepID=B8B5Q3_ORYSI|nr:hypothetical protein OsI_25851 [Oryza sativa Indica Group]